MTGARRVVAGRVAEAVSTTSPARLQELAADASPRVRVAVAENPGVSDDLLTVLLRDDDHLVRVTAAGTAVDREALESELVRSPDPWVRFIFVSAACATGRIPSRASQELLVRDGMAESREMLAQITSYRDLFDLLLRDERPSVRGWCAANPRADRTAVDALLRDPDRRARRAAVASGLSFPDAEHLAVAARDRSADVRWAVLYRAGAPRALAESLVDDPMEDVRTAAQTMVSKSGLWGPGAEEEALVDRAERRRRAEIGTWMQA